MLRSYLLPRISSRPFPHPFPQNPIRISSPRPQGTYHTQSAMGNTGMSTNCGGTVSIDSRAQDRRKLTRVKCSALALIASTQHVHSSPRELHSSPRLLRYSHSLPSLDPQALGHTYSLSVCTESALRSTHDVPRHPEDERQFTPGPSITIANTSLSKHKLLESLLEVIDSLCD